MFAARSSIYPINATGRTPARNRLSLC